MAAVLVLVVIGLIVVVVEVAWKGFVESKLQFRKTDADIAIYVQL